MAFQDQELLRCEARHPDESEACRRCAEQLLGYFGDVIYVQ
jgi:ribosomal protein L40E